MSRNAVLVVDDDPMNRELLGAILSSAGIAYEAVDGGAAAIDSLRANHYSVVLLDMLMPVVDGFDVIQFLISTNPRVLERVIVVSALGDKFVANFDPTLVRAFFRKPVDRAGLLAEVKSVIADELESTQRERSSSGEDAS